MQWGKNSFKKIQRLKKMSFVCVTFFFFFFFLNESEAAPVVPVEKVSVEPCLQVCLLSVFGHKSLL